MQAPPTEQRAFQHRQTWLCIQKWGRREKKMARDRHNTLSCWHGQRHLTHLCEISWIIKLGVQLYAWIWIAVTFRLPFPVHSFANRSKTRWATLERANRILTWSTARSNGEPSGDDFENRQLELKDWGVESGGCGGGGRLEVGTDSPQAFDFYTVANGHISGNRAKGGQKRPLKCKGWIKVVFQGMSFSGDIPPTPQSLEACSFFFPSF